MHVGAVGGRAAQPLQLRLSTCAVDLLTTSVGPLAGGERPAERLDHAERVLALDDAEEVEAEQEHEPGGQAQLGPAPTPAGALDHRQRHRAPARRRRRRMASAEWAAEVHTSSTRSAAPRIERGNSSTSHAHMPIVWRRRLRAAEAVERRRAAGRR